jgi:hypothetical protein
LNLLLLFPNLLQNLGWFEADVLAKQRGKGEETLAAAVMPAVAVDLPIEISPRAAIKYQDRESLYNVFHVQFRA